MWFGHLGVLIRAVVFRYITDMCVFHDISWHISAISIMYMVLSGISSVKYRRDTHILIYKDIFSAMYQNEAEVLITPIL